MVSIVAALVLVGLKLGTGLVVGSLALVSAGIESAGDVIAAVLTLLAIRWAGKPADEDHPYGHRRAENLSALGEAAIITGGAIIIVVEAVGRLVGEAEPPETSWPLFGVIAIAIVIDVSRIVVSIRTAHRYNSAALRSNAFNFAGDLAGSVSVLVGLALVAIGIEQGDVLAALLVAGIIFFGAGRLIADNAGVLMDRTPADAERRARKAIGGLGGGIGLRRLRLRESGGHAFADVVVSVPPAVAVVEAHVVTERVEEAIRAVLPRSDVVVHVEPRTEGLELRDHVLAAALAEPLVHEVHDVTLYPGEGGTIVSLHLKFPAGLSVGAAHAVAEQVEAAIGNHVDVAGVQTHLEPLEQPRSQRRPPAALDGQLGEALRAVGRRHGHIALQEAEVVDSDAGRVVFVRLQLPPLTALSEAHRVAGEVEEDLRRELPDLADVVVHTEPRRTEA